MHKYILFLALFIGVINADITNNEIEDGNEDEIRKPAKFSCVNGESDFCKSFCEKYTCEPKKCICETPLLLSCRKAKGACLKEATLKNLSANECKKSTYKGSYCVLAPVSAETAPEVPAIDEGASPSNSTPTF